jgi:hypothetical protein
MTLDLYSRVLPAPQHEAADWLAALVLEDWQLQNDCVATLDSLQNCLTIKGKSRATGLSFSDIQVNWVDEPDELPDCSTPRRLRYGV